MAKPTQARLRELFALDEATGVLKRLITTSNRCVAGKRAGTLDKSTGYRRVRVDGVVYGEHQVILCMRTGLWPVGQVDHRDGGRDKNMPKNLRDVSRRVNQENKRKAHKNNQTGYLGVYKQRNGRFGAKITSHGVVHNLGTFDTALEAHNVYLAAKRVLHVGCTI